MLPQGRAGSIRWRPLDSSPEPSRRTVNAHQRRDVARGSRVRGKGSDTDPMWSGASPGRRMTLFCVVFLLLILFFSSVTSTRLVGVVLHEHLTRLITTIAASVLALFGDVAVSGRYLSFNGFGASIEGACDGVQPTYIYISAVLATPSRWRDRAWGLLIGIPIIFLINLIRVGTVIVCGAYWPKWVDWVHLYGWQALLIVLTMAAWVFWAERFARRGYQTPS